MKRRPNYCILFGKNMNKSPTKCICFYLWIMMPKFISNRLLKRLSDKKGADKSSIIFTDLFGAEKCKEACKKGQSKKRRKYAPGPVVMC